LATFHLGYCNTLQNDHRDFDQWKSRSARADR
jgi:hypothetical protein